MKNSIDNTADVIDSRDLIERIDELREMRTPYSAGWNMPGYMPDADPARFADADDARDYLACEMDREADEIDETAEIAERRGESAATVAALRADAEQLREAAEQLRKISGDDDAAEYGRTIGGLHYWIACDDSPTAGLNDDEARELEQLEAFAADLRGYGDFEHGESLIRDSYFVEYARELAEDSGAIDPRASWPLNCIDWEQAASELKTDYTCAEFDGVTYWMRA